MRNISLVRALKCILIVLFLLFSTYTWVCLSLSIEYDLYSFDFIGKDIALLYFIVNLFGVLIITNGIILFIALFKSTRLIRNVSLVFLVVFDLFVLFSSLKINYHFPYNGSFSFWRIAIRYIYPILLLYNILTIIISHYFFTDSKPK